MGPQNINADITPTSLHSDLAKYIRHHFVDLTQLVKLCNILRKILIYTFTSVYLDNEIYSVSITTKYNITYDKMVN